MVKRSTCHDCGTKEGQLHVLGCDMERCPFCSNQLISCQCVYKKLGIDVSPGAWAYSHGLTDAQQGDWKKLLSDKGRILSLPQTQNGWSETTSGGAGASRPISGKAAMWSTPPGNGN